MIQKFLSVNQISESAFVFWNNFNGHIRKARKEKSYEGAQSELQTELKKKRL